MKYSYLIFLILILLSYRSQAQHVTDFTLQNINGKIVSLSDFKKAKGFVIVFTCNHCPFAQFYPQRLNKLNKKYKALGVPLIAINPMDTLVYADENLEKMKAVAAKNKFNFPYLLDASQKTAKDFNAIRTPEAFLIWKENEKWTIKYKGAIDDNGAEPSKIEHHFLENAIKEQLKGKNITEAETISVGCKINYRKG